MHFYFYTKTLLYTEGMVLVYSQIFPLTKLGTQNAHAKASTCAPTVCVCVCVRGTKCTCLYSVS